MEILLKWIVIIIGVVSFLIFLAVYVGVLSRQWTRARLDEADRHLKRTLMFGLGTKEEEEKNGKIEEETRH